MGTPHTVVRLFGEIQLGVRRVQVHVGVARLPHSSIWKGFQSVSLNPYLDNHHQIDPGATRADEKQLCCRPGTAVKFLWPALIRH
jgi:hypothetical protein